MLQPVKKKERKYKRWGGDKKEKKKKKKEEKYMWVEERGYQFAISLRQL